MVKCIIFSLFKTHNVNFQQNIWFFIILILMAEGFCLGARAGKAVPIQNHRGLLESVRLWFFFSTWMLKVSCLLGHFVVETKYVSQYKHENFLNHAPKTY